MALAVVAVTRSAPPIRDTTVEGVPADWVATPPGDALVSGHDGWDSLSESERPVHCNANALRLVRPVATTTSYSPGRHWTGPPVAVPFHVPHWVPATVAVKAAPAGA